MKKNKILIGALLVLLILAIVLTVVLFSCAGPRDKANQGTTGAQMNGESTSSTEETNSNTEGTTVPEDTTEATEETTTETKPSGSSSLGGTGGFEGGGSNMGGSEGGTSDPTQPPELEVPVHGTQLNPYGEVITEKTKEITTVAIPAGGEVYYYLDGAMGTDLTLVDTDAVLTTDVPAAAAAAQGTEAVVSIPLQQEAGPVLVKLQNVGAAEKAFTLGVDPMIGTQLNPQLIEDITSVNVTVPANWFGGYYLTWNVPSDGLLTVTPEVIAPLNGKCTLILKNGEVLGTDLAGGKSLTVQGGDVVKLQLITEPVDQQANVKLVFDYAPEQGTLLNPIQITDVTQPIQAQVAAGQTVYYRGNVTGMILSGTDVQGAAIVIDGQVVAEATEGSLEMKVPAPAMEGQILFGVRNTTQTDAAYTLHLNWPLGHIENPEELTLGEHVATLAGDTDGYYYTWTAQEEGYFTLTIFTSMAEKGWQYQITNLTQNLAGEWVDHTMDDGSSMQDVYVKPGDQLSVIVGTFDPNNWSVAPAGTVKIDASFKTMPGTQGNPYSVTAEELASYTTHTVQPGQTIYYEAHRVYDMTLTVHTTTAAISINGTEYLPQEGVILIRNLPGSNKQSVQLTVRNTGTEAANYLLEAVRPVGVVSNPDTLVMGSNTAKTEEESNGYFYTWTAPESGTLALNMGAGSWQYVLNNTGTGVYGETVTPDTVGVSHVYEVAQDDIIELMVAPYDPADSNAIPVGTVTFEAAFTPTPGSINNPIALTVEDFPYGAELEAGAKVYYTLTGGEGKSLEIKSAWGLKLYMGGTAQYPNSSTGVLAAADLTSPVTFGLENTGTASGTFTLDLKSPAALGSSANPHKLTELGALTVQITENIYYYEWTAPANGTFTFGLNSGQSNWKFQVINASKNENSNIFTYSNPFSTRGTSITVEKDNVIVFWVQLKNGASAGSFNATASFKADEAAAASAVPQTLASAMAWFADRTVMKLHTELIGIIR